jgi:hypothetical protein
MNLQQIVSLVIDAARRANETALALWQDYPIHPHFSSDANAGLYPWWGQRFTNARTLLEPATILKVNVKFPSLAYETFV